MSIWIHLWPPPRQMPPPPVAVGSRSRVGSGVWKCVSLVFLDPKPIYRAQNLQSKGVFVFLNRSGQILDTLYICKPPFQQLWKDILNFKWEPCWQSSTQTSHWEEGDHIRIATFRTWNLPSNAVTPEVGKGPCYGPGSLPHCCSSHVKA